MKGDSGDFATESFLERWLDKETEGEAYHSVLRGASTPRVKVCRRAESAAWPSVVRPSADPRSAEWPSVVRGDVETKGEALGATQPKHAAVAPESCSIPWWRFLGRPWSGVWRWVLGGGAGICLLLGWLMSANPETHILYTVAMAACVPAALVTLFCELEVTRRVNWAVALAVAAGGGGLAILLSSVLETLTGWESVFLAGVIEEPAKGAMLLVLLTAFPNRFRGILSGLALGVCVGAGFAVIETVGYAYTFGEEGEPSTAVLLLRGVLSPFMHMGWTGALGGALWAARSRPSEAWAAWAIFGGMVVLHCLWNTLGPLTHFSALLWVLIFCYVKRGVAEASGWGFLPKGAD